jgi:hypothetical protein
MNKNNPNEIPDTDTSTMRKNMVLGEGVDARLITPKQFELSEQVDAALPPDVAPAIHLARAIKVLRPAHVHQEVLKFLAEIECAPQAEDERQEPAQ